MQLNGDICLPPGLYILHEQCLIRFQFYIRQPDGLTVCGTVAAAQSVKTGPCRLLGKVEQPHQRFLAVLAYQCQDAGVVGVPGGYPRIRGKALVCSHFA